MRKILVTAYDIDPFKGSESATGWNLILQISRYNDTIAITRKNNRGNIEKFLAQQEIKNLTFHYFDLPYWMRFWKRGSRGSSLYFYLWQLFMPLYIKTSKITFDIAHNLNFHTDSFPTFLWALGKPLVWGPINHHEKIPLNYLYGKHSKKEFFKDRITWCLKLFLWNCDPFVWISKKKASKILVGNTSVQKRLRLNQNKISNISQIASELPDQKYYAEESSVFTVLFIGRLVPLKGGDIAIHAFAEFIKNRSSENIKLKIIGKGSEKDKLVYLTKKLGIRKSVLFVDWLPKSSISQHYKDANVFFFPSHEGAGMVVAEAISYGLPVLCFQNFGPGELVDDSCAIRIPYTAYNTSIKDFACALDKFYTEPKLTAQKSKNAYQLFLNKYTWDCKGDSLLEVYQSI